MITLQLNKCYCLGTYIFPFGVMKKYLINKSKNHVQVGEKSWCITQVSEGGETQDQSLLNVPCFYSNA